MMTATTLAQALTVKPPEVKAWVARGLPWHGTARRRKFDEHEVALWLVNEGEFASDAAQLNGHATGKVVATIADAAVELAVNERTLKSWLKLPGFPGRPGEQGRHQAGRFPIDTIRTWRAAYFGTGEGGEFAAARLTDRREGARSKRLKNDLLEGRLYYREDVERNAAELTTRIAGRLEELPTELAAELPAKDRPRLKRRLAERVRAILLEFAAWRPLPNRRADHEPPPT